jgi:hypothetical protein
MNMNGERLRLLIALLSFLLGTFLSPCPIWAQTGATTLRTPWGDPDLQGIWSNQYVTPLERAKQYGTREFLTKEELAAEEQRLREQAKALGRDERAAPGTERDVQGAYNQFWSGIPIVLRGPRTSMIVDPADGRIPPYTEDAKKKIDARLDYLGALLQGTSGGRPGPISSRRLEPPPDYNLERMNRADGPEDRSSGERCFGSNMPVFGGVSRIVQSRDAVSIHYDIGQGEGFTSVIPITNNPHLPNNVRQRYGDARGHWEGDTLVVDVTNFNGRNEYRGSRENLHLIERYRRIDAETLSIQITIDDQTTWTRPWTAIQQLNRDNDKKNQVYEANCHEGNYGLVGMLANTRAAEKAFAEGRGPDPATQDNGSGFSETNRFGGR